MRIDGLFNGQPLNQPNVLDILSRLNIGDVIRAKVLEMTSGELMLKLFDGTVFRAAVASDIGAKPGELLELAVSGKSDGSIFLETVKKNIKSESMQNEIKKLLIGMDIAPGPENMELAGEFKAAGMKIAPEVFKKAAELLSRFSELTPEKAVFLASKNIKPAEGDTGTLLKLLEGRLKLGSQLDELQTLVSSLENAPAKAGAAKAASAPASNVQITPDAQPQAGTPAQAVVKAPAEQASNAILAENSQIRPDTDTAGAKTAAAMPPPDEPGHAAASGPRPRPHAAEAAPITAKDADGSGDMQDKILSNLNTDDGPEFLKPGGDKLKEAGLKILREEAGDLEKLKNTFKSMFISTDSEELKSELDVKKLYTDLTDKLDVIKSTAAYSGLPGSDEIAARANSINDGIKLLSQINSSTAYYQIPLNLSGYNTTGELYVMKREHSRKRINPRDVTMFISLDTRNIGRIETIIDIKEKNVSINLRAEEKQIIDFIKENYKFLYTGLVEKGYRLVDIRYRLIEDATNPVNMERNIKKELEGGRFSVDARI